MSLAKLHRCRLDELRLEPAQWEILLAFLNHNLRNAVSPRQLLAERQAGLPTGALAQVGIDRVIATLETLDAQWHKAKEVES